PVIVVPPGKEFGKGIQKVGFACDFKDVVDTTPGNVIKEVVKQFNATLHVLNVGFSGRQVDIEAGEYILLKTMLEEVKPTYDFIQNSDVENGINEFAEKNNLDLVITIPKKHKLLDGIFKKSSTRKLVFHSHIPVMCVHED
ncbi:MAG TPA: universal stress protein, partial [Chitinophagaceae bacterium]|nr:universal stress protein [Chitinophagaceae bacterium]